MAKHWDSQLLVSLSPSSVITLIFSLSLASYDYEWTLLPGFLSFSSICASTVAWSLWFWGSMCDVNGCVQQCKRAQFVHAPCICTATMCLLQCVCVTMCVVTVAWKILKVSVFTNVGASVDFDWALCLLMIDVVVHFDLFFLRCWWCWIFCCCLILYIILVFLWFDASSYGGWGCHL